MLSCFERDSFSRSFSFSEFLTFSILACHFLPSSHRTISSLVCPTCIKSLHVHHININNILKGCRKQQSFSVVSQKAIGEPLRLNTFAREGFQMTNGNFGQQIWSKFLQRSVQPLQTNAFFQISCSAY